MKKPRLRLRRKPEPTAVLAFPRPGHVYTMNGTRYVVTHISLDGQGSLNLTLLEERMYRLHYYLDL